LSDLHTLAGWQALDLGRITESWQHYEEAKSAARESDSIPFEIHAAGEQAFVLLDIHETASAVELLNSVQATATRTCPPLLRAWLAAAHGEALAADNQRNKSLRAFDTAADLLSGAQADSDGPYLALSPVHLARWRGQALAQFADIEATSVLNKALTELDPTFIRAETSLRIDLAIALTDLDETDQARHQTRKASSLAQQIGSARQQRRIEKLVYRKNPLIQ